jgi:hypothetical protein
MKLWLHKKNICTRSSWIGLHMKVVLICFNKLKVPLNFFLINSTIYDHEILYACQHRHNNINVNKNQFFWYNESKTDSY